ncbi:hypothetical protein SUDANB95_02638 [Actinosynnema sp. ALI-1.44]
MTLTVSDLKNARPALWWTAAEDARDAAHHCHDVSSLARNEVARTLQVCWVDQAGEEATRSFTRHADTYEAAATVLEGLMSTYGALAQAVEAAQRALGDALDFASRYCLGVSEAGVVTGNTDTDLGKWAVNCASLMVSAALTAANQADERAAGRLRVITALTDSTDPAAVRRALDAAAGDPVQIALRLLGAGELHPLNIPAELMDAVRRAARETGVSESLLLAIVWQEQQWYQNFEPDGGPLTETWRFLEWTAQQTIEPDKSLGITHMKMDTIREVMNGNREAFTTEDGTFLGDLGDADLAAYVEKNPEENIRLSAHHLAQLAENPHGASTDKQLFLLYAADTDQVRDYNDRYGDSTAARSGDIRDRAAAWDSFQSRLDDTNAWSRLTEQQRRQALADIAANSPRHAPVDLHPLYPAGSSTTRGTGTPGDEPFLPYPVERPPRPR